MSLLQNLAKATIALTLTAGLESTVRAGECPSYEEISRRPTVCSTHTKVTAEEVKARYAQGQRDFKCYEIAGGDLTEADLSKANFTGYILVAN